MPVSFLDPNNTRAGYFRVVFANVTGFQFSGSEGVLTFGILRNMANASDGAEEQVAVAMSPINLKALSYSLTRIIESFEKASGVEIPVAPELAVAIDRSIDAAKPKK
jgi:hypothetical protein